MTAPTSTALDMTLERSQHPAALVDQFERAKAVTARLVREPLADHEQAVDPADNGVPVEVPLRQEHAHQG